MPGTIDPVMKHRGAQLRKLRQDKGVYQQTVADAVGGLSKSAVSEWERGVSAPGRETLSELDRYFGGQGDVLRIYGFEPSAPSNADLLRILEQIRGVVADTNVVLRLLAEKQKVQIPARLLRAEDPPAVLVGRRTTDRR